MRLAGFLGCFLLGHFVDASKPSSQFGGIVKVEFMHQSRVTERSFLLTGSNSTMFTHHAPVPPQDGIWGELVPFFPLDACTILRPSNYTQKVGSSLQLTTVGPSPHVVALVARGNCSFEEKFDNVDDVPNVIGLLMFDILDGQSLSNDIEISTFERTRIPGFLIEHKTGIELLNQISKMRAGARTNSTDSQWIKVTLGYVPFSGPIADILQYVILAIMGALTVAFVSSVYMHYRIYRMQRDLGQNQMNEARAAIKIDESFLEKLPVKRFRGAGELKGLFHEDGAGVEPDSTQAPKVAVVEIEEVCEGPHHAPANETCPICLDEFTIGEVINELPCGHNYHILCIQPWLQHRSPECPLCKADVRDAYLDVTPVDPAVAKQRLWRRIKNRIRRLLCCGSKAGDGAAAGAEAVGTGTRAPPGMTEVRIATPDHDDAHSRIGPTHPVPLGMP